MASKLVDDDYIIDPEGKRAKDCRVRVTVVHPGNFHAFSHFQIYHKLEGDLTNKLKAMNYNLIPKKVHQKFESIRDNGKVPEKTKIFVISQDEHVGGIPTDDESDECLMDLLVVCENRDKQNFHRKGDGLNEQVQYYVPNTVLYRNLKEEDLVTILSKIDIENTFVRLVERQTIYGTCKEVIITYKMWKEIQELFSAKAYYLLTSNFHWMLTKKDSNEFVQKHRDDEDYVYKHCWDDKINLPDEKIEEILGNNSCIDFVPLFKMVHYEWDKSGKHNLETDWSWASYLITDDVQMCIACLGWVSIEGIAPTMPQRDPPAHMGYYDNKLCNGATPASQSGHRYTEGDQHDNCPDRLREDHPGSIEYVYPGSNNLEPESYAKLDNWTEMNKRLVMLGAERIGAGLKMDEIFDSVELLIKKLGAKDE